MRKDVFLGMTIGGGVLAVIIGYLIFNPGSKHDKHTVDTSINENGGQEPTASTNDGSAQGGSPGNPPPGNPLADKPTTLMPGLPDSTDPWTKVLNGTKPLVTPGQTGPIARARNTESPGGAEGGPGQSNTGIPDGAGALSGGIHGGARSISAVPGNGSKPRTHRIQKGETFTSIAAAAYGNRNLWGAIAKANPTVNPSRLKLGAEIILPDPAEVKTAEVKTAETAANTDSPATPAARRAEAAIDPKTEYRVQAGDSLHKICMKRYGRSDMVDKIYDLNKTAIGADKAKLKLGMVLKLPAAPVAATN